MAFSKKITSLFLVGVYMFSAIATRELLKLPILLEHYYDHKENNQQSGFISFLTTHYYTEDGTDQDAAEDNRLPFKSVANVSIFFFTAVPPPASIELAHTSESTISASFNISANPFLPSQFMAAIWQPPRSY